jgi:uncharacterized protein YjbI with pentapeptide repeats
MAPLAAQAGRTVRPRKAGLRGPVYLFQERRKTMVETILVEGRAFQESCGTFAALPTEAIFLYCQFEGFAIDGRTVDGALINCALDGVDWYWGFFNVALVARTTFKNCVFRGCSFRGVDFVECRLENCRFIRDNLESPCVFDNCRLVECVFEGCVVEADSRPIRAPVFTKTRFYGCARKRCRGMEALF